MTGRLLLVATPLSKEPEAIEHSLPPQVVLNVHRISHFLVENAKSARAFLKAINYPRPLSSCVIEELELCRDPRQRAMTALHQSEERGYADAEVWDWLRAGNDVGLLSEAGYPCVADPGEEIVLLAHRKGIDVVPLVGLSSIVLALAASGLMGERFAFHGYLPRVADALEPVLGSLERNSSREQSAQVFIETPYRTPWLLEQLIRCLRRDTLLCVASDLTTPGSQVVTLPIDGWRSRSVAEFRRNSVFVLMAAARPQ